MSPKPLTGAQIRAARALIRWSAEDLARQCALGLATIRRAELSEEETSMTVANDLAVRRALEASGVEFLDENGGGVGVRFRRTRHTWKGSEGERLRRFLRLGSKGSGRIGYDAVYVTT